MLSQLHQALVHKIRLYEDLKAALDEEKKVIRKGNIALFQKFLLKKEIIVKKLRNLEDKRKDILIKIADDMGLSFDDISLSKITKKANGPIVDKLKQARKQLFELINAIDKLNMYNEKLISNSSLSNEKFIAFFNSFNKSSSYAPNGKIGNSTPKRWVLNAEV